MVLAKKDDEEIKKIQPNFVGPMPQQQKFNTVMPQTLERASKDAMAVPKKSLASTTPQSLKRAGVIEGREQKIIKTQRLILKTQPYKPPVKRYIARKPFETREQAFIREQPNENKTQTNLQKQRVILKDALYRGVEGAAKVGGMARNTIVKPARYLLNKRYENRAKNSRKSLFDNQVGSQTNLLSMKATKSVINQAGNQQPVINRASNILKFNREQYIEPKQNFNKSKEKWW